MKSVIERARTILEAAEKSGNKDALIDKFTLHYINHIDIKAAKDWIDEERTARKVLPDTVKEVFGDNVTEASLAKLERCFALSQNEKFIFVDDDYTNWEYEATDSCWKGQFFNYFAPHGQQTTFCVVENTNNIMPTPALSMMRSIKGWTNEVTHIKNPFIDKKLYPLAYIDGRLFFTNNPNHITLNDKWGNGTIYYIRTNNFAIKAKFIKTEVEDTTAKIFKLDGTAPSIIKSSELASLIESRADEIINSFVDFCKTNSNETLKVSYQDEHLKSVLSMVLSLQTIGYFIKKIGLPYSLEFVVEKYYEVNNKQNNIGANQPTSEERDNWLNMMGNELVEDLEHDKNIKGTLIPVVSSPKKALPHWRVLTFEYAGKKLCIYPDGGFMNGWFIYNDPKKSRHIYELSTITYDTEIYLSRNQDIKFDITIEE